MYPLGGRRSTSAASHARGRVIHFAAVSEEAASNTPNRSLLAAVPWAVYLGMSWTWCIGMFLPVLLVRQFGLAAFWVFAVPNVLGAAAMGFILRDGASQRLVDQHRSACAAFSAATIAFHVFFTAWMVRSLLGDWGALITLSATGLFYVVGRGLPGGDRPMAAAVLILSVMTFIIILTRLRFLPAAVPPNAPLPDLGSLAAVCIFGFVLCPYLDLTFHRARQANTASAAKVAFALGFGIFFLAMIGFTLAYAGTLLPLLEGAGAAKLPSDNARVLKLAQTYVGFHIAAQSAFTVAIHLRELTGLPIRTRRPSLTLLAISCVAAAAAGLWAARGGTLLNLDRGELVYRLFMSFYALLFPAYVYICMMPASPPGRRGLLVVGAAVLASSPFFYLAMIRGRMAWLPVGLAIVLASRLFARAGHRTTAVAAGSHSGVSGMN